MQPLPGNPALREAAGTWTFSHTGPSPIESRNALELQVMTENKLLGSLLSINANGDASMVSLGQARNFKVEVLEESEQFIAIGIPGEGLDKAMHYDKRSGLLIFPVAVADSGSQGLMPAYYRRFQL